MYSQLVFLLFLFIKSSFSDIVLTSKVLISTRLDPIYGPNAIGSHLHNIAGGNRFNATTQNDTEFLLSSSCTTSPITVDKSLYWAPGMYFMNQTNSTNSTTFTRLPSTFKIWYKVIGTNVTAFPKGFRMVAGSATTNTYNSSSVENQAISWVCYDAMNNPNTTTCFPPVDCPSEYTTYSPPIYYRLNCVSDWIG
jgi:hypothetical protein